MPRIPKIVVLAVLVIAGAMLWAHWRSDARRIGRRLAAVAELMEKEGPEADLATLGIARKVSTYFAPGFVVLAPPYEGQVTDAQQLVGAVARYRRSVETARVELTDRAIEVDRARGTAVVGFVASVSATSGGGPGRETYRVRTRWAEDDQAGWRISELELLERLDEGSLFWP